MGDGGELERMHVQNPQATATVAGGMGMGMGWASRRGYSRCGSGTRRRGRAAGRSVSRGRRSKGEGEGEGEGGGEVRIRRHMSRQPPSTSSSIAHRPSPVSSPSPSPSPSQPSLSVALSWWEGQRRRIHSTCTRIRTPSSLNSPTRHAVEDPAMVYLMIGVGGDKTEKDKGMVELSIPKTRTMQLHPKPRDEARAGQEHQLLRGKDGDRAEGIRKGETRCWIRRHGLARGGRLAGKESDSQSC